MTMVGSASAASGGEVLDRVQCVGARQVRPDGPRVGRGTEQPCSRRGGLRHRLRRDDACQRPRDSRSPPAEPRIGASPSTTTRNSASPPLPATNSVTMRNGLTGYWGAPGRRAAPMGKARSAVIDRRRFMISPRRGGRLPFAMGFDDKTVRRFIPEFPCPRTESMRSPPRHAAQLRRDGRRGRGVPAVGGQVPPHARGLEPGARHRGDGQGGVATAINSISAPGTWFGDVEQGRRVSRLSATNTPRRSRATIPGGFGAFSPPCPCPTSKAA